MGMKVPLRVLSLGWGVQSFTLAAMAAVGEIEPIDAAIHADTTHERSATYAFAAKWTAWLEEHDVRVVTVTPPDAEAIDRFGGMMLPAYTITDKGDGKMSRQCTDKWKRATIRRWLQSNRNRKPVEMWLGISHDEWQRAKDSDVKYITHRWPLLERNLTRNDCTNWLERHSLEVPGKSACVFCPLQRKREWSEIKHSPEDWRKAVATDEAIRRSRPPYDLFVHPARIPLVDVDLSTPEDHGQLPIWQQTCEGGYCWA